MIPNGVFSCHVAVIHGASEAILKLRALIANGDFDMH
jgi:hypothetical protein